MVLENKPVQPAIITFLYIVVYSTVQNRIVQYSIVCHKVNCLEYSVKNNLQEAGSKGFP
mgnify:CR=1 FL=1